MNEPSPSPLVQQETVPGPSTVNSSVDELRLIWRAVSPKDESQRKFNRDIYVPVNSPRTDEVAFAEATLNARVFFFERDLVAGKRKTAYINHARFLVAVTVFFAVVSLFVPVSLFVSLVSLAFLTFSSVSVGRIQGLKVLRNDWLSARMDTELTRVFLGLAHIRWAQSRLTSRPVNLAADWRELRDKLESSPGDKAKFIEDPSSLNGDLGLDRARRGLSGHDLSNIDGARYQAFVQWAERYQELRTKWQMTYLNEHRQADKERLHRIDAYCVFTLAASVTVLVVLAALSSTPALAGWIHERVPMITPELLTWASKSANGVAGVILTLAATTKKYLEIDSLAERVKRNDSYYARQFQINAAIDAILTSGADSPSSVIAITQYCIETEVASLQEHHRFLMDSKGSKFSV